MRPRRSGRSGSASARNVDYSPGLRALLEQLRAAGIGVKEAFVDSGAVQTMPFARPHFDELIAALDFAVAKSYHARGEYSGALPQ